MPPTDNLPGVAGAGVEKIEIKELDKLIGIYENKKAARCAESPGEIEAKRNLRLSLLKHQDKLPKNEAGERYYRFEYEDGEFKDYTLAESLKVKKVKNSGDDDE